MKKSFDTIAEDYLGKEYYNSIIYTNKIVILELIVKEMFLRNSNGPDVDYIRNIYRDAKETGWVREELL